MRKILPLLFALLLLFPLLSATAEENLLKNGNFEEEADGWPAHWQKDMWISDIGVSYLSLVEGQDGGLCAMVENVVENDARFVQTVSVKPNTIYRLYGLVRAEGCGVENAGANLSILDCYELFPEIYDTFGDWTEIECYVRTDSGQKNLRIAARLGGYSADNTGKAWFDDLSFEKVDEVPAGASVIQLTEYVAAARGKESQTATGEKGPSYVTVVLFLLLAVCAFVLYRHDVSLPKALFWALLLAAAALRAYLMLLRPGYVNDINTFFSWALRMVEVGPTAFYQQDLFCDYPPGYMYILWMTGGLLKLFGINSYDATLGGAAVRAVVKLVPVLADLATMAILWRMAKKRIGDTPALLLCALYAASPAVLMDGAIWGQSDAVMALFLLLTAHLAVERKWMWALPVFTVTVLMKPQALMAGPVGLTALLLDMKQAGLLFPKEEKTKPKGKKAEKVQQPGKDAKLVADTLKGIGLSVAVAVLLLAPFVWGKENPIGWVVTLYQNTMSGYRYATVNTANLYYLIGANWAPLEETLGALSYGTLGTLLMAATVAFSVILHWKRARRENLPFFLALTYIGLYLLGVMMHERYLYPALALLLLSYLQKKDFRILLLFIGFSLTMYLNCALVLRDLHLPLGVGFWAGVLSALNLLLGGLCVWVALDVKTRPLPPPDREAKEALYKAADDRRLQSFSKKTPAFLQTLRRADYLAMAVITLVYSVIGYTALGVRVAPQTLWMSTGSGEEIVFDLGQTQTFQVMYYAGINQRNQTLTLEFSEDGSDWYGAEAGGQEMRSMAHMMVEEGHCFSWRYATQALYDVNGEPVEWNDQPISGFGRYARVTAYSPSVSLMEMVFRDMDGQVIPVQEVYSTGYHAEKYYDPALLADESSTMPEHPSYMNSTYFDEIYHARTGYEHANEMSTYEWTHPPLGKIFIMLGIKLFGMTPFGWRFMGTLAGVLMVPAMFLLGKLLFKKTKYAALAAFLMAFDMMHLTQTRIATIDSYAVLFIILMYLCMFRYLQMSFFRDGWKTLLPLGLCGVFFGLGCASKWICIYSGAGLAVLFAWSMVSRYLEWRAAVRSQDKLLQARAARYVSYLSGTIGFCVAFFIIIPFSIYYFSYIPHFAWEGGLTFQRFVQTQSAIFRYHSQLVDNHDFKSPWYEWPLIVKPMYYYNGTRYAGVNRVASIMCMGNPAIWWVGLVTFLYMAWRWLKPRLTLQENKDSRPAMLLIAFAAQFVPWMLVPRSMFIYHYFGSLPFVMLSIVYVFERIDRKKPSVFRALAIGYAALVLILFIGFYPFATGIPFPRIWADAMNWLTALRLPVWAHGRWLIY